MQDNVIENYVWLLTKQQNKQKPSMSPKPQISSSETFVDAVTAVPNNKAVGESHTTTSTQEPPLPTHRKTFFCGLLDSRKSVIIFNALAIVGSGLLLIPAKLRIDAANDNVRASTTYTDAEIEDNVDILDRLFWYITALTIAGFVVRALAIFGAIQFCTRYLVANIIYMIANLTLTLVFSFQAKRKAEEYGYGASDWIPKVMGTAIALAVHITLVREIMTGVTTKATYPPEEKTCCCVV